VTSLKLNKNTHRPHSGWLPHIHPVNFQLAAFFLTYNSRPYVPDGNQFYASLRDSRRVRGSHSHKTNWDSGKERRMVARPLSRHRNGWVQTPSSISPSSGTVPGLSQIKEGFLLGRKWPSYDCKVVIYYLFPLLKSGERREQSWTLYAHGIFSKAFLPRALPNSQSPGISRPQGLLGILITAVYRSWRSSNWRVLGRIN